MGKRKEVLRGVKWRGFDPHGWKINVEQCSVLNEWSFFFMDEIYHIDGNLL